MVEEQSKAPRVAVTPPKICGQAAENGGQLRSRATAHLLVGGDENVLVFAFGCHGVVVRPPRLPRGSELSTGNDALIFVTARQAAGQYNGRGGDARLEFAVRSRRGIVGQIPCEFRSKGSQPAYDMRRRQGYEPPVARFRRV